MTSLPRRARSLVAVLIAALVAAACGASAGTPAVPTRTATPAPSASASAAPSATAPSPATPSATSGSSEPTLDPDAVGLRLEPVLAGLDAPLGVTHAGDGSDRLFVVEQGGRILASDPDGREPTVFLDIADRITSGGERGLLGLAFHPDFAQNGRLVTNYTDRAGDTVIAEFTADGETADPASERILLTVEQPYPNHNGGAVAFGPDGYLYVAMGDGGSGGDPEDHGERLDTLLGKILRIGVDPDGDREYTIPADNPYLGMDGARPEIGHTGLRNPWRIAFDRATGDLWIADVGQNRLEEVDVARAGQLGLDFGWDRFEGRDCFEPPDGCDPAGFTLPVAQYSHDLGCSVTGGSVYRGTASPALTGVYVFGDLCSGLVFGIRADGPAEQEPVVLLESGATLSSFGEDEAGELYLVDLSGGTVQRLVAGG